LAQEFTDDIREDFIMPSIVGKFKSILKQPEDEDFYDNTEPQSDVMDAEPDMFDDMGDEPVSDNSSSSSGNVMNMNVGASVQFVLFKPEAFDPTVKKMADELMQMHTVILNVEDTNKDVSRRIIDFLGGVAYANNGNVKKVAEDTFIIMPSNVTLSGQDAMDEVGSDNVYF